MSRKKETIPQKRITLRIPFYLSKIIKKVALEEETTVTCFLVRAIYKMLQDEYGYEEEFPSWSDFAQEKNGLLTTFGFKKNQIKEVCEKKDKEVNDSESEKEIRQYIREKAPWFKILTDL